jgi:transcriptional regulator with XRE-family HTH domain
MSSQTSDTSTQLERERTADTSTASNLDTIRRLQRSYEELTGPVRVLNEDVEAGRREVREWDLDERTAAKARSDALSLLEELSTDRGLGWSDIARLCGVSVSAVRKWRAGEPPSPERRRELARLAAFVDLLDEIAPVADPASWLLMPLVDGRTVTAADLYLGRQSNDLLEHAQGHLGVHDLLNRWNPNWREHTRSDWQIVIAADGERSITRRG